MKRTLMVGLVLCLAAAASAVVIDKVQVKQTFGASAEYTYADGNLQWSGGAGGYIFTEGGNFIGFDDAVINADFDLASDDSSGGVAKARFNLVGSWSVSLYRASNPVVIITGNMNSGGGFGSKYWEEETGLERLDGKAWVNIVSFWADPAWVADEIVPVYGLDGITWDEDLVAGLDSDVTLNPGTGDLLNYGQNYSSSDGLTVTLFSDQSQVVPEPMTMLLLGLGAVLLRKK